MGDIFFCCYVYLRLYLFGQQVLEASSKKSLEQGTGLFEPGRSRAELQKNAKTTWTVQDLGDKLILRSQLCSGCQSVLTSVLPTRALVTVQLCPEKVLVNRCFLSGGENETGEKGGTKEGGERRKMLF